MASNTLAEPNLAGRLNATAVAHSPPAMAAMVVTTAMTARSWPIVLAVHGGYQPAEYELPSPVKNSLGPREDCWAVFNPAVPCCLPRGSREPPRGEVEEIEAGSVLARKLPTRATKFSRDPSKRWSRGHGRPGQRTRQQGEAPASWGGLASGARRITYVASLLLRKLLCPSAGLCLCLEPGGRKAGELVGMHGSWAPPTSAFNASFPGQTCGLAVRSRLA